MDLEKLLPKDPNGGGGNISMTDESKVELVTKGRHTYFKPIKESHINGLRKWEQAFRVYAAIYTQANPTRATEIWQYMHVINVAASAYQWLNLAYYDLTFRQLMAYRPNRSWAKTYNQGWNLSMKEPLGSKGMVPEVASEGSAAGSHFSDNKRSRKDWRDDCCWKFNRN